MKDIFIGLIAVVALVLGGYGLVKPQPTQQPEQQPFGASGTEFTELAHFYNNITVGGVVMSTTSLVSTYTPTALELSKAPKIISWLPNVNTTLSISASSTRSYIPNVGDTAEFYVRNASTTAAATITFAAADTGVDLQFAEATGGDLVLSGLDWAKVTLIRTSTHLVTVIFDEMTEAD